VKSVLFVDDEQRILDGLRDLLRKHRRKWDMTFAAGPEAALAEMDLRSFDVVVSDMRMPGMDGAQLLSHVKARSPHTVQIILSGHSEVEAALRAVPFAHQFLSKPCDARTIESTIDRAVGLAAMIHDERLREVVGRIEKLPSLPAVYQELMEMLQRAEASTADFARVIARDVAMCAKVLQIVNSAFFGLPRRVADVETALVYLGLNTMRSLVLVAHVFSASAAGLRVDELQQASILASRIARRLLPDKTQADDAAMAAMLCDIGALVLATQFPEEYADLLTAAQASPLHDLEQELFGVTHAEVGGYLLGLWGLPFPIVEAVTYHHSPASVPHPAFDVVAATHIAVVLAGTHVRTSLGVSPFDEQYLEAVGAKDKLAGWQALAAKIAGGG
jgi:HD-like signal output (HDOD) protein